ncbi:hypothetical protein ACFL0T_05860 [Candidatus Omnitrophota bacterium]
MKQKKLKIKTFKIKNRRGYAALCCDHLTEGSTALQAKDRMEKALRRRLKRKPIQPRV